MRLFTKKDFGNGEVMWNHLDDVDPKLPLRKQESLIGCEDVLTVKYANGYWLDVSFFQRSSSKAHFVVVVVGPDEEWESAAQRKCETFDELRKTVIELAPIAESGKEATAASAPEIKKRSARRTLRKTR